MPAKCIGCNNVAKTKKGWCSVECYRKNQKLVENKGRFKLGHDTSDKIREIIKLSNIEWHKNNKELSLKNIKLMNTKEANLKKSHKGEKHPRWIKDRSKLKTKKMYL